MAKCRFCAGDLEQENSACSSCGYNPQTDTIDPSFNLQPQAKRRKQKDKSGSRARRGVSSGVKKFAYFGIALLIFSILYKYNFNVGFAFAEVRHIFTLVRTGKIVELWKSDKKESKEDKTVSLMDVRSFISPNSSDYKNLIIEGIFFDPIEDGFVIINGEVVPEGGSFKGATVERIDKDSVEIIADGVTKVLETNQSIPFPRNR